MILNQAKINGNDIYTTYGVGISDGLKNMRRPADPKEADEYEWPERNGKEYFINDKVQDIEVSLSCWLEGSSIADLIAKQNAFTDMLRDPSLKDFLEIASNITYKVKYNKISSYDTKITGNGTPAITFNLELTIVQDYANQPTTTYILDGKH